MGVSENRGYLIWGPYNKDPSIYKGTKLGSPIFGNSPKSRVRDFTETCSSILRPTSGEKPTETNPKAPCTHIVGT